VLTLLSQSISQAKRTQQLHGPYVSDVHFGPSRRLVIPLDEHAPDAMMCKCESCDQADRARTNNENWDFVLVGCKGLGGILDEFVVY
jgi:hypothetical protein